MPQFAPNEAKTAIAPIIAKPSGMNCEAELFLGPDEATKVVTSGREPFVSTGAEKNVSLPITMPGAPGTFHGYIDVFAGGFRFLAYILKEDVVIAAPTLSFGFGTPVVTIEANKQAPAWGVARVSCLLTNPHNVTVTRRLRCCWAYSTEPSTFYCNRAWNGGITEFELTLNPGGSYALVSPYYYYGADGIEASNSPLIGVGKKFYYRFQDDLGNSSPAVLK